MWSTKSILSYQNGSASSALNRSDVLMESSLHADVPDEKLASDLLCCDGHDKDNECLDVIRKKLISNLSLNVFCSDLDNKPIKMEPKEISEERLTVIQKILVQIGQLSDAEKLLLYLKLPSSTSSSSDPLRQPLNPLGNRQEIQQTIVWIKTHLEEDREISIPKQNVYDQYLRYCQNVSMKPLSTADFGKVMKQVYPGVRPRRLGTRGNSRYCYSGMRSTSKLPTPVLPQLVSQKNLINGTSKRGVFRNFGLSSRVQECEKNKNEKTKRKLKTSSRTNKTCSSSRSAKCNLKVCSPRNPKRTKVENSIKENESVCGDSFLKEAVEIKKADGSENWSVEEANLEGCSDNPLKTVHPSSSGLVDDFHIYMKANDKIKSDKTNSVKNDCGANLTVNNGNCTICKDAEMNELTDEKMIEELDKSSVEQHKQSLPPSYKVQQNKITCDKSNIDKCDLRKQVAEDAIESERGFSSPAQVESNTQKLKVRRSNSFSKYQRNFTKNYVPIQPKPVGNSTLTLHFGLAGSLPVTSGKGCEENDSQEPEEEIVRYFQHTEGNPLFEYGIMQKAVKDIKNGSVQIRNSVQNLLNSGCVNPAETSNYIFQSRSQSCFEGQYKISKPMRNSKNLFFQTRSQSTVELSAKERRVSINDKSSANLDYSPGSFTICDNDAVSHLRLLLEKSAVGEPNKSTTKTGSVICMAKNDQLNPLKHDSTAVNPLTIVDLKSEVGTSANNNGVVPKMLKLGDQNNFSESAGPVPPSPNTRSKYFNFTPISPGPQSPLKSAITPLTGHVFPTTNNTTLGQEQMAFGFMTPVKSTNLVGLRMNENLKDIVQEKVSNYGNKTGSSTPLGLHDICDNFKKEIIPDCNLSNYPRAITSGRPRSNSSTNFYRTKAKRSLAKVLSCDHFSSRDLDRGENSVGDFLLMPGSLQFQSSSEVIRADGNFFPSEMRQLLDSNSKIQDVQSSTSRSQSVPLNRMISEQSWFPDQAPDLYTPYLSSENEAAMEVGPSIPPREYSGFASSSDCETKTLNSFITNEEINVSMDQMTDGIFGRDGRDIENMVQLNDQLFSENFESDNSASYGQGNSFAHESVFSDKIGLNSNPIFDTSFPAESNWNISDSVKSYLAEFSQSPEKKMVEMADEVSANCDKPFSDSLFSCGN